MKIKFDFNKSKLIRFGVFILILVTLVSAGDVIFKAGDFDIEGDLNVSGNVTADYFLGNGSQLTDINYIESDPIFLNENVSLWNEALNKFNLTYDSYALNVSKNYTKLTYDTYNTAWSGAGGNLSWNESLANSLYLGVNNRSENVVFEKNVTAEDSLFVDDYIGIGTTAPTHTLDVVGDSNFTGNVIIEKNLNVTGKGYFGTVNYFGDGSNYVPIGANFRWYLDGDQGMYLSSSGLSLMAGYDLTVVENVTANYFIGDGSELTGIDGTYFGAYRTDLYDIAGANTWYDLPFNIEAVIKQGITHTHDGVSPENITIGKSGFYEISFHLHCLQDTIFSARLLRNGNEIPGSFRQAYSHSASAWIITQLDGNFGVALVDGDVIELQVSATNAGADVTDFDIPNPPDVRVSASIFIQSIDGIIDCGGGSATKEFFVPPTRDAATMKSSFTTAPMTSTQATGFNFYTPHDFNALVNAVIVLIPDASETIQADISSSIASVGEAYNVDDDSVLDAQIVTVANELAEWDVSSLLTTMSADDYVGVYFQSDINTLLTIGLRIKYL